MRAKRTNRVAWRVVVALVSVLVGGIASVVVYGQQTGRFTLALRLREGPPEWGRRGFVTRRVHGPHGSEQYLVGTIYGLGPADLVVRYPRPVSFLRGWRHGYPIFDRIPESQQAGPAAPPPPTRSDASGEVPERRVPTDQ